MNKLRLLLLIQFHFSIENLPYPQNVKSSLICLPLNDQTSIPTSCYLRATARHDTDQVGP